MYLLHLISESWRRREASEGSSISSDCALRALDLGPKRKLEVACGMSWTSVLEGYHFGHGYNCSRISDIDDDDERGSRIEGQINR